MSVHRGENKDNAKRTLTRHFKEGVHYEVTNSHPRHVLLSPLIFGAQAPIFPNKYRFKLGIATKP